MATALLFVTTLICATGWFYRWGLSEMLIMLLDDKGYPKPTVEEVERNMRRVVNRLFREDS